MEFKSGPWQHYRQTLHESIVEALCNCSEMLKKEIKVLDVKEGYLQTQPLLVLPRSNVSLTI